MSLKALLNRAQFQAERSAGNVIPLRKFDANACSDEIMALDVEARKIAGRIEDVRRNYEETIAVMENELEKITEKLNAKRAEWRQHSELIGGV